MVDRLGDARITATLRGDNPERVLGQAEALRKRLPVALEITFTVPGAADVIRELFNRGHDLVGAGTVLTEQQLDEAVEAGADFLVSPVLSQAVRERLETRQGPLLIPGCATPTEIVTARQAGAEIVKVFPIARLGGAAYLSDLAGPLPGLKIMASGGIAVAGVRAYLNAGAWTVALGSALNSPGAADEIEPMLVSRGGFEGSNGRTVRSSAEAIREA